MSMESDPFAFLQDCTASQVASILSGESTRVAGVVLSFVPRTVAAQVLADISEAQRREVVQQMAEARAISQPVLETLADTVRQKLELSTTPAPAKPHPTQTIPRGANPYVPAPSATRPPARPAPASRPQGNAPHPPSHTSRSAPTRSHDAPHPSGTTTPASRRDAAMQNALSLAKSKRATKSSASSKPIPVHGAALAAEILRQSGADVRNLIAKEEPALFKTLCKRTYVFDDLEATPVEALGTLFLEVEPETAALALRFASDALQERVLQHTSPRRAKWIAEEMERSAGQPVGMREIEAAQQKVIDRAVSLQQEGRILIDPDDPDRV